MSEWISVKDRVPSEWEEVLIHQHHAEYWVGYYRNDKKWISTCCDNEGTAIEGVTHWMELPDPPEVEYESNSDKKE